MEPIFRATLLLAVSGTLLFVWEFFFLIRSVRLRRFAWFAVLLQGVLLVGIPLTFTQTTYHGHHEPGPVVPTLSPSIDVAVPEIRGVREYAPLPVLDEIDIPATRFAAKTQANLETAVLMIWFGGIVFFVAQWLFGYVRLFVLVRKWEPAPDEWSTAWNELTGKRSISLYVSNNVGPSLIRLPFRYLLVVPRSAWERLTPEQRNRVMKHELAHLQRHDLWTSLAAWLLTIPHWFNPLAWIALHRFADAAELACDDAAHGRTERGVAEYCQALILLQGSGPHRTAFGHSVQGRNISDRISRLVHFHSLEKGDSLMKRILIVSAILVLLAVGLFRVHVVAQQPSHEPGPAVPTLPEESGPQLSAREEEDFMRVIDERPVIHNGVETTFPVRLRDTFTYDGKSFEEWKTASETELNPERHVEIVKALATFGRKGYGTEATAAILRLLDDHPDLHFQTTGQRDSFANSVANAFRNKIPLKFSLPLLVKASTVGSGEEVGKYINVLAATLAGIDFPSSSKDELKPLVPLFLDMISLELKASTAGLDSKGLSTVYHLLGRFYPEVQTAMEKAAFGSGNPEFRTVLVDALLMSADKKPEEKLKKYLPKLVDLLLSDNLDDQETAGMVVLNVGRNFREITFLRPSPGSRPFAWCKPGTSFYDNNDVFRTVFLSLFATDPIGEATAKFLKGVAPKRTLSDDFEAIKKEMSSRNQPLSLLVIDSDTLKPLGRTERLRERLKDSPEILKLFNELVASASR